MATFEEIQEVQVDSGSPINEALMLGDDDTETGGVKFNFDALNDRVTTLEGAGGGGNPITRFQVNGNLSRLRALLANDSRAGEKLDGSLVTATKTYIKSRLFIKKNGLTGQLKCDVKAHSKTNHPIKSLQHQGNYLTQSVGRLGTTLLTQSISKRTPQVLTQSISRTETAKTITSVVNVEGDFFKINISGAVFDSAKWKEGANVVISGINASNNGVHEIIEVNHEGSPSILIENAGGVEETAVSGTLNLNRFSYVLINPADTVGFKVGENLEASGHTLAANDGLLLIDAVNEGANNLVVYNNNVSADVQAGVAGTIDCTRYVYTFLSAVLTTDYFVGENLLAASHSSANNNGNFPIVAINESGNNLVVVNDVGDEQAGVAGNVETNRWIYGLNTSADGEVLVNDTVRMESHTSSANDGNFVALEISRDALDNIVVYNEAGVVQAGVAGTIKTEKMIVEFFADHSASFNIVTWKSYANIIGMPETTNNGNFEVVEINRTTNDNIVIKNIAAVEQADPVGEVDYESRSLFSTLPTIEAGEDYESSSNGVLIASSIVAESKLMLDILELPEGNLPEDVTLTIE